MQIGLIVSFGTICDASEEKLFPSTFYGVQGGLVAIGQLVANGWSKSKITRWKTSTSG